MSIDLYKAAAQMALRFPSSKGPLTVEQLFTIPLSSKGDFSLDAVAKAVNADLKAAGEESFVEVNTNPKREVLALKLEIVKDVIATIQAANKAQIESQNKRIERQKLLALLDNKKEQELANLSTEEIEARLATLG